MIKKTIWTIILTLLLQSSLGALGTMEEDSQKQILEAQAASESGILILPEIFLRGYDPISIFFDKNTGPEKGGPLDNSRPIVQIIPDHPGEYKWIDARTLQFFPTIPWAPLERYKVICGSETRQLATLLVPPERVYPSPGSSNMEPFNQFLLSFGHILDPAKLKEMITFEIKPLPGVGDEDITWLTEKDFEIKEQERSSPSDPYSCSITLRNNITYGKHITMHLKLSLEGGIPGSAAKYTYQTKPAFKLSAMGSNYTSYPVASRGSVYTMDQAINCGNGNSPLFVEFSENITYPDIETIKHMVKFEPAVKNLSFNTSGKRIYIYFDAERDKPYKMILKHGEIKSRSDRPLASFGETSFWFYYTQKSSYLKWSQGSGIVERYGPQLFPMEGRALEQIDLRIYKIDPESLNFWPFPANPVDIDEESAPPMPGEEPEYGTKLKEQIKLLGTPHLSEVISLPITENSIRSRFGLDMAPYFARISGTQAPGTYLVGYRLLGSSTKRYYVRLTVTDLSLTTVEEEHGINFIVTSLKTGKPISGARINVEGEFKEGLKTIISGITDGSGQFHYEHTYDIEKPLKRIIISQGKDLLILNPGDPPPHFQNNHWFNSSSSWLAWLNRKPVKEKAKPSYKGFILTERPIYRPEEPVHILGYIRTRQEGKIIRSPEDRTYKVVVRGPGRKTWSLDPQFHDLGNFYVLFEDTDIPTGSYTAELIDEKDNRVLDQVPFKKEAYRVPRFELNISGPEKVPLDRPFELILTADYYAGGRVAGQSVYWKVTQYRHQVRPLYFPGYIFSSDERFDDGRWYRSTGTQYHEDITDENGSATLELNPAAEDSGIPKRYEVEATVRGADAQTVSTTKTVYALPPFIIGLKTPRFIQDKKTIVPEIIVIGHDENPLPGKELTLRLYQRQWHSYLTESDFTTGQARYNSDVVDDLLEEITLTSGTKPLTPELKVLDSGVYIVEVLGRDNLGRMQRVQTDLYVAGETPVTWKKTKANIFETSLDKNSYEPGDQATLLLKSPFQEARALVILEGPRDNEYHWVDIKGGQGLFTFEIKEDMTPRLPVHTVLTRGRLEGTGGGNSWKDDRGKPVTMANTTWITVEPAINQIILTLEHEKQVLPGAELKMKIRMTDSKGRPLSGTAALWLIDRAVLALEKEHFSNPLDNFIDPVRTHLRVRDTRNTVIGNLTVEEVPGGGGDDWETMALKEADQLMERTTVRKNFRTVAYFNDQIPIYNGEGEVTIDMPENLTDFAVRAIGISGFEKFGIRKSRVAVRLPLIVQPALPRFVRPGDSFTAGGIGRVVEGEGGKGSVQIKVEGMTLDNYKQTDVSRVDWEVNRPQQLFFPMTVPIDYETPGRETVRVSLAVERDYDKVNDGFQMDLPIRLDVSPTFIENPLEVSAERAVFIPPVNEKYRKGSLERKLTLSSEPGILKLASGLKYLEGYVHGCTEQRISKFYPQVAMEGLLTSLGYNEKPEKNKEVFRQLIEYLESVTAPNGLVSFWPGSQSYVHLTAYVVEFLAASREAGYDVPDKLLNSQTRALKEALRSDYGYFATTYDAFLERVEALLALDAAEYFDSTYAEELLDACFTSDLYTQARILDLFVKHNQTNQMRVKRLLNQLESSLVYQMIDGKEVFQGLQYRRTRWGGYTLITQTRTLAAVLKAIYRANPDNPELTEIYDHLVARASSGGWGSTRDNIAAFMAIKEIIEINIKNNKYDHKMELSTGGKTFSIDTEGKIAFVHQDDSPASGYLSFKSGNKQKLPAGKVEITYLPYATGDNTVTYSRGFHVKREHMQVSRENQIVARESINAGRSLSYPMDMIIEEHVEVRNTENNYYVAVVVPFAAGFEIMNPSLATAPAEATPTNKMTREPSYSYYGDDEVIFYYDYLPEGTYHFYFRLKASFQGAFIQPAARAELMYDLGVWGRSEGCKIIIAGQETEEGK